MSETNSENIDDESDNYVIPDSFKWIDEPKYFIKIKGRTLRFSQRHMFLDIQDNIHVKLFCINGCCPIESKLIPNENNLYKFRKGDFVALIEELPEFYTHECMGFNADRTFKKQFPDDLKREQDDPLNNPKLSRKKKFAYIDKMDTDEDTKQLFRESVLFMESM